MRIGYLGHFFSKFRWLKSAKNKENVLNYNMLLHIWKDCNQYIFSFANLI